MIHEVDDALRELLRAEALHGRDVELSLDAPTRQWAARRQAPTVNIYLYDIREDPRLGQRGVINEYDKDGTITARRIPPRYVRLSYLVTVWGERPEDEHRIMSSLVSALFQCEALPASYLTGSLADAGLPIPVTVASPSGRDNAVSSLWTALGGHLRPSLDVVISVPVDGERRFLADKPVDEGLRLLMGGDDLVGHRRRTDQRGPSGGEPGHTRDEPPAPQVAVLRSAGRRSA